MRVFKFDMKIKKDINKLNFDVSFINKYKNKLRIIYKNKIYPLNHKFSNIDNNIKILKINLISLEYLSIYEIYKIQYIKTNENKSIWDRYEDEEEDDRIRLFGKIFIENHKDKCLIIYNNEIFPLQEYFLINDIENKDRLEIKLLIFEKINSLTCLFDKCKSLTKIELFENNENISNKDKEDNLKNKMTIIDEKNNETNKLNNSIEEKDIYSSKSITNLSVTDYISKVNQQYNKSFSSLYSYNKIFNYNMKNICIKSKSIIYLPNIKYMGYMFRYCSSLKSLPDISKFDTKNVIYMFGMFEDCSSLLVLPDISKWNTDNVIDMKDMFFGCSSLLSLPEIGRAHV